MRRRRIGSAVISLVLALSATAGAGARILAGEPDKAAEAARLQKCFRACVATEGAKYVRNRDEILKSPLLAEYLAAKKKLWESRKPSPQEEAVYHYLRAWTQHAKTYRRVLQLDLYRTRWGEGHGGRFDPGPGLGIGVFRELAKDKASLLLLVESLDKSGQIRFQHDGITGSLYVLGLICKGEFRPIIQAGKGYRIAKEDVAKIAEKEIPKEILPGTWDKENLVRVANKVLVRGPIGVDDGPTDLSDFRMECAKVLETLGSPKSVQPIVQAAAAEENREALAALRRALSACTKTEEGKKELESVRRRMESLFKPSGKESESKDESQD